MFKFPNIELTKFHCSQNLKNNLCALSNSTVSAASTLLVAALHAFKIIKKPLKQRKKVSSNLKNSLLK